MTEDEFRKGPQAKPFDVAAAMAHIEKRVETYMASTGDIRATLTDYLMIQLLREMRGVAEALGKINAAMLSDTEAVDLLKAVQDDAESRKRWALTDEERKALLGDDPMRPMHSGSVIGIAGKPMYDAIRGGGAGALSGDGIGGTDGSHGNGAALSGGYMACTICGEKFDLGTGHRCATGRKTL